MPSNARHVKWKDASRRSPNATVEASQRQTDWPSRGRLRDVLRNREIGARAVRMQLPALRLLTGPWQDVFDDVSGMLMHV